MKFFLPITRDEAQAEYMWAGMRELLARNGFPTERSRIHALFFRRDGEPRVLQVGIDDAETGEPVILIYRSADAPLYWVLTPAFGLLEATPMAVPAQGTRAVEFGPGLEGPRRRGRRSRRPPA